MIYVCKLKSHLNTSRLIVIILVNTIHRISAENDNGIITLSLYNVRLDQALYLFLRTNKLIDGIDNFINRFFMSL